MVAAKSNDIGKALFAYWRVVLSAIAGFLFAGIQSSCGLLPEASFTLSPDSKVPRGIAFPSGLTRSDVVIRLDYYIGFSGRRYVVTLQDKKGRKLDEVSGYLGKSIGAATDYPACEQVNLWGHKETIVHMRMEPLFYLMDECPIKHSENGPASN